MKRDAALTQADFGRGTAEHDELLWETFVETDLWAGVINGRVDVVLGAKGSGKSAIYARVFRMNRQLRHRGIELVGAENISDDPVFQELPNIGSLTGRQFIGLWKLYILTLVGDKLRKMRLRDSEASRVVATLQAAKLLPATEESTLIELFQRVLRYVQVDLDFELGVNSPAVLPVGGSAKVSAKITIHEPSPEQREQGAISVHRLLLAAGEALTKRNLTIWLMVDRLDAAFPAADEGLESTALRALIQTYVDMLGKNYRLSLKLFLRDDVWDRIIRAPGDPIVGANAVETRVIRWSDNALINLMARRITHNKGICQLYNAKDSKVKAHPRLQYDLVARVMPRTSDSSQGGPGSNYWILELLRDGTGHVAPRELILLLSFARQTQLDRIGLALATFEGTELFELATLREAMQLVSEFRLFQTLCTEHPHLVVPIGQLRGIQAEQTGDNLALLWREPIMTSNRITDQLVSLGFFEKRVNDATETYRIAPLYRPALAISD